MLWPHTVVQTLDSDDPPNKSLSSGKVFQGNQLRYPLDSYLSSGQRYPPFKQLGPQAETKAKFANLGTPMRQVWGNVPFVKVTQCQDRSQSEF